MYIIHRHGFVSDLQASWPPWCRARSPLEGDPARWVKKNRSLQLACLSIGNFTIPTVSHSYVSKGFFKQPGAEKYRQLRDCILTVGLNFRLGWAEEQTHIDLKIRKFMAKEWTLQRYSKISVLTVWKWVVISVVRLRCSSMFNRTVSRCSCSSGRATEWAPVTTWSYS